MPSHPKISLSNARIVLPDRVIEAGSITIEKGRITSIGADERAQSLVSENFDLNGATVYPGFIDVHIHGSVGIDVMDATPDALKKVSQFLAAQGVTSWLPTFVPAPEDGYQRAITAIDRGIEENGSGARIIGVHYEGPFVNSAQCGALHSDHFKTFQSPGELDQLPVLKNSALKMITLAPEIEGGLELVRELHRRGWVISIGHTRAAADVLDQACEAGARHMTHFMNAMPQLHHRQPGPVGWGLSRDDVTCDVIADGIHLHPLTLRVLMRAKGPGGLSLISDAIAAAGKGDGEYQIWGETISVKNARTSNARGSIAGSVITMLDAVKMMRSIGATEVESARMASTNPARLLRLDHECGSIEEGKRADLVALDRDGNVRLTMVGGKIVFPV